MAKPVKEIVPPPLRTKETELNKAIDDIRRALQEIYRELKRLEKEKVNV